MPTEHAPGLIVRGITPPLALTDFKLVAFDMDSTLINIECVDEIAAAVGRKPEVAAITEAAMRGEIADYKESLRRRVALLKGVPEAALHEVYTQRLQLNPGVERFVQACQAAGLKTLLVSGGFTFFADYIGKRIGFDEAMANTLEFDGDGLAGTVADPILGKQAKLTRLEALVAEHDIPIAATLAVGDGANDLAMIKAAGMGVTLHAKPIVAAEASVRIDHADLTALLYLQGYSDEEFVR